MFEVIINKYPRIHNISLTLNKLIEHFITDLPQLTDEHSCERNNLYQLIFATHLPFFKRKTLLISSEYRCYNIKLFKNSLYLHIRNCESSRKPVSVPYTKAPESILIIKHLPE